MTDDRFAAVVAIDFGTSRSGFAWAEPRAANSYVSTHEDYPNRRGRYPKTLTALLVGPDTTVTHWGFEALDQSFAYHPAFHGPDAPIFLTRFKSKILGARESITPKELRRRGKNLVPANVIGSYLLSLKNYALNKIAERMRRQPSPIRWCLTVPAIWTEQERQALRNAARDYAGIGIGPDQLLLLSEPEAAAVYCVRDHLAEGGPDQPLGALLGADRHVVVVDAGGGTVDIAFHRVEEDGSLVETKPPLGAPLGATRLDEAFWIFLRRRLTPRFLFHALSDESASRELNAKLIAENWEDAKTRFTGEDKPYFVGVPRGVEAAMDESVRARLRLRHSNDLVLSLRDMNLIFAPTINQIVDVIRTALQGARYDYLFVVGGFAESPILTSRIRAEFTPSLDPERIIFPSYSSAAVLIGAVRYGLNPQVIRSRLSLWTYGCECAMPFDTNLDPITWQITSAGKKYCINRFCEFLRAGDAVPPGKEFSQTFSVLDPRQKEATIRLFRTKDKNPRYTPHPDAPRGEAGHPSPVFEQRVMTIPLEGTGWRDVKVTLTARDVDFEIAVKDVSADKPYPFECPLFTTVVPEDI